jgi:multiple sugar transport system ATP-binding protein
VSTVELRNITKIYDPDVCAVNKANLIIEDKEFVVLVGPSGCGKSTILRMIAGLEDITEGEILIDGQVVNDVPPKERDIAMVFQNYALYPHMTVFENMAFGLKLRKIPKEEIKQRVANAAKLLDINEFLERRPKALSGGQRQRVAVGRAIVRKPKVFLFDEPLSNLDAKLRVQTRIEINRLHKQLQTTMVYVTHDQIEAMTMGSKIVVLKDGFIQQVDRPLELYNNPVNKFVAGFIGSPAMNFFRGNLTRNKNVSFQSALLNFDLTTEIGQKLMPFTGKELILGLRPEDLLSGQQIKPDSIKLKQSIKVDVVEPVGNEIYVYFSDEVHSYCMRTPSRQVFKPDEQIQTAINPERLYFFDPATDKRIYW